MTGTIADVGNARMKDVHVRYGGVLRPRERATWDVAVRAELAEPGYAERLAMAHLGLAEQCSSLIPASEISDDPKSNRLLAEVPEGDFRRWLPDLEAVELPLGQVLYEAGDVLRYAYFPTTAIVSLLYVMKDGASAEIAVVGRDGILGIALFMGGESTSSRAVVQNAGRAFRLKAEAVKNAFDRGGAVLHLLLRYTQALMTQMVQTAACNKHHTLDQQLCRWLLLSLDRLGSNRLEMTQQLIANMLGVLPEKVQAGALELQAAGLLRYADGTIAITDRRGLERRSCECYQVVKAEYERLLPQEVAT